MFIAGYLKNQICQQVVWHCWCGLSEQRIINNFLSDGEPAQESVNSSRLVLSENEAGISNGSLLINPVLKSDSGNYMCLISQYSIQHNTTTEVRVKGMCLLYLTPKGQAVLTRWLLRVGCWSHKYLLQALIIHEIYMLQ